MSNQDNFYVKNGNVREIGAPENSFAQNSANSANSDDEWKDFDFNSVNLENRREKAARTLPKREILRFVIFGFFAGILIWVLRFALENWLMRPLFCRTPDTAAVCASADATSFVIALVLIGAISAAVLARARVFRAVLISVATFTAFGALWTIFSAQQNVVFAGFLAALFGAGLYLFFALIGAVKKYSLAAVLLAVLVVAFWLVARL